MNVLPAAVAALLAGAVGLSGCGGGGASSASTPAGQSSSSTANGASSASAHNAQDATFASQMIGHHTQAIAMSKLAATRASSPQVKDLAARIEGAQQPEIGLMNKMLKSWGSSGNDGGMAMMGHGNDGMATKAQLTKLKNANGATFDRLFLTLMTAHHRGAIMMAKKEQKGGKSSQAISLAGRIRNAQAGEIKEMAALMKTASQT